MAQSRTIVVGEGFLTCAHANLNLFEGSTAASENGAHTPMHTRSRHKKAYTTLGRTTTQRMLRGSSKVKRISTASLQGGSVNRNTATETKTLK